MSKTRTNGPCELKLGSRFRRRQDRDNTVCGGRWEIRIFDFNGGIGIVILQDNTRRPRLVRASPHQRICIDNAECGMHRPDAKYAVRPRHKFILSSAVRSLPGSLRHVRHDSVTITSAGRTHWRERGAGDAQTPKPAIIRLPTTEPGAWARDWFRAMRPTPASAAVPTMRQGRQSW